MSRLIALAGTVSFICICIAVDRKRGVKLPIDLFPALLWFLFGASRNLSQWLWPSDTLQATGADYLAGSPVDRAFLLLLTVMGAIVLARRRLPWREILWHNRWLVLFLAYLAVSVLWSRYGSVSFKRLVKLLGDVIMALVVITHDGDPGRHFVAMIRRVGQILLPLSLLLVKYYREMGVSYTLDGMFEMWTGVSTHKNNLGMLASVTGVVLLMTATEGEGKLHRVLDLVLVGVALLLLKGSATAFSATSLAIAAIGVLTLGFAGLAWRTVGRAPVKSLSWALVVPPLLSAGLLFSASLPAFGFVLTQLGRDATLTGRSVLWARLLEIASSHRLLGVGYGAFWIGDLANQLWRSFSWRPTQAHNGYLDLYVELGVAGFSVAVLMLLGAIRNVGRSFGVGFRLGALRAALVLMVLFNNITESSLAKPTHLLWLVFLCCTISVPAWYSREKGSMERAELAASEGGPEQVRALPEGT